MLTVRLITVGTLKESYLREAVEEYRKRLGAFCKFEEICLKESRLPQNPSEAEIASALSAEGKQILAQMPSRAYRIALCVEGKQQTSEEFAALLDRICTESGELCLVIGSSYGLSPEVKQATNLQLSVSKLTFPHQLMRVILCETLYRSLSILKGSKYHK